MTIFPTRNEYWVWTRPWPSLPLFLTLEGTQVLGTLAAVHGILVEPIGWVCALAVWAYSLVRLLVNTLVRLLVNNVVKLLTHRVMGRSRAGS